jgi:hypothetical protein
VNDIFPIIEVPDNADQSNEDMGTKYKFWYLDSQLGRCLFKEARLNTGEDWAEKITAELAKLLGLPHVNYELATFKNKPGSISQSMLPKKAILQHGNEILSSLISSYPSSATYGVRQHTIDLVIQAIDLPTVFPPYNWELPTGINSAIDTFIGYLMLDTWVSNSDRHHENWGFIVLDNKFYLAPTYDHGSSLGRELLDTKRQGIFTNGSVSNYIQNSRSAMYRTVNDKKALLNIEVFSIIFERYPDTAKVWLQNLAQISPDDITELLQKVPQTRLSPLAQRFTHQILIQNQIRLLDIGDSLS